VAKVTFRFYGRFAFFHAGPKVSVIAPTFPVEEPHTPFMSITQDKLIVFDDLKRRVTTLQPKLRIGNDLDIKDPHGDDDRSPQSLVWDLTGLIVRHGTSTTEVPTSKHEPLDIVALDKLRPRTEEEEHAPLRLNPDALEPGRGLSNAVIHINGGKRLTRAIKVNDVHLGLHDDVKVKGQDATPLPKGTPLTKTPGEFVEFAITVAGTSIQLTFTDFQGNTEHVTVRLKTETTISFSHFCPTIRQTGLPKFDLEFATYYNLVMPPLPPHKDRVVPFLKRGSLGEGMGCYLNARIGE
jgi:hypothetical protein